MRVRFTWWVTVTEDGGGKITQCGHTDAEIAAMPRAGEVVWFGNFGLTVRSVHYHNGEHPSVCLERRDDVKAEYQLEQLRQPWASADPAVVP
jgi:hypothetical protein